MAEPLSPEVKDKVIAAYSNMLEEIHKAGGDPKYFTAEYLVRIPAHDLMITLARNNIKFVWEG